MTQFQVPLRIPPVLSPVASDATTDYYGIAMQQNKVEILPGLSTTIWGYNGQFPGPTIKARVGRQTLVRQFNNLPEPMVVHNHGMASLPQYDGYPDDIIQPGAYKDYIYPNDRAATFWYHDHTMHSAGFRIYKGLTGFYLVGDDVEDSLPLPKGKYDIPLMIQDRMLAGNGELIYNSRGNNGALGMTILVNGVPWPRFEVANRKYRFRILNGSNARPYLLALSSGQPLIAIGTDGGLMSAPVTTSQMRLGVSERYDVIVDFSVYPIGTQVVLLNLVGETPGLQQIMRFDVVRQESDDSTIPATLRTVERIPESVAVRTRDWNFSRGEGGAWVINGKTWDSNRVDATPSLGDVEVWRLENNFNDMSHPIHLHLVKFQILDRNGKPPLPYEAGWKDTTYVGENEVVRIIVPFGPNKGKYLMHCHNLEHEDQMQMTQFQVL
jgi:FtsP/CotA-like multicopper oxidase with cupredoxin domain